MSDVEFTSHAEWLADFVRRNGRAPGPKERYTGPGCPRRVEDEAGTALQVSGNALRTAVQIGRDEEFQRQLQQFNLTCATAGGASPSSASQARHLDPKLGGGKPMMALLPWAALEAVTRVMDGGAKKYGRDSWRQILIHSGDEASRRAAFEEYLSAAVRHIAAEMRGVRVDESGELSLAHAACNLLFLVEALTLLRE